jgi:hypothetical protein
MLRTSFPFNPLKTEGILRKFPKVIELTQKWKDFKNNGSVWKLVSIHFLDVDNSDIELSDKKFVILKKHFRSDSTVISWFWHAFEQWKLQWSADDGQCDSMHGAILGFDCFGRFIVTFPWLIAMCKTLSGNYVVNLYQCSWTLELYPVPS